MFSVTRHGYTSTTELMTSVVSDMTANGFTLVYPVGSVTNLATLEAGNTVDVDMAATQPWRIRIDAVTDDVIKINAGTNMQLTGDGSVTKLDNGVETSGHFGTQTANVGDTFYFINRKNLSTAEKSATPMSYKLSIANHGVVLCIWEPGSDSDPSSTNIQNQSWFVIQRIVKNSDGSVFKTGKSPVFALYSIYHQSYGSGGTSSSPNVDEMKALVIRESDILRPTTAYSVSTDHEDVNRFINVKNQVCITEDNNYVITFPNGLNTARYAYPQHELDLVAYTSADVLSQGSSVNLTLYGEANPRVYTGMAANGAFNTGMRILMLVSSDTV